MSFGFFGGDVRFMIGVGEECSVVVVVVQGFAGEFVGSGLEMCAVTPRFPKQRINANINIRVSTTTEYYIYFSKFI